MLWSRRSIEDRIKSAVQEAISPYISEHEAHLADCAMYRKSTKKTLKAIQRVLEVATKDRNVQHQQNLVSLRWQRALLISILLAMMGFLGSQSFTRLFAAGVPGAH